jgi:two-component system osmolarity sensor histidine kinase EnvZ
MAVNYLDESWIIFSASSRTFWLSRSTRLALWLAYATCAVIAVQALAAWQLSRPIVKLSDAVRQFGINRPAPPIAESGPKELREVIAAFNAMRAQIEKFIAYRVTMLAAISHDLRTPLTRMRLRGEFIEDEEQQARLFRDVDEMQAMIDSALAFFRDDAAEEMFTEVDLPGVLKTIVNDFADQGVEILYHGPAHATCRGRPFALKRAFTNLIENAVKYGSPPEIVLTQQDHRILVTIRDEGPGIPDEALEAVFNPYFRLERSRNRNSGGVGLGLTAAQSILRGHGGDIILRNRASGGLDAEATLPV